MEGQFPDGVLGVVFPGEGFFSVDLLLLRIQFDFNVVIGDPGRQGAGLGKDRATKEPTR